MRREKARLLSKFWLWMVPLLALMTACNGFRVNANKMENVSLDKFDTYAWLPVPDSAGTLEPAVQNNLVNAVNKEMQLRGYRLDAANPDLLILVHRNFNQKASLDTDPVYTSPLYTSYGYFEPGFYTGPMYPYYYTGYTSIPYVSGAEYDVDVVQNTVGKLIIDVIDADKKQIIWRGWAKDQVMQKGDLPESMARYVDEIYDEFPVEQNQDG